jgi:hypothetical protein
LQLSSARLPYGKRPDVGTPFRECWIAEVGIAEVGLPPSALASIGRTQVNQLGQSVAPHGQLLRTKLLFTLFCTVKAMNDSSEANYSAPANELERAIDLAQKGEITEVEMINTFLAGEIVVVLNKLLAEGEELGETQFLGFGISDGHEGVAVYTSEERVPEALGEFEHPRKTSLGGIVGALEEGVGIAVNPGQSYSFEISPEGLAALKAELFGESGA